MRIMAAPYPLRRCAASVTTLPVMTMPSAISNRAEATGAPVSETRLTLIDDSTGQPAQVFGDDGISAFPSTIVTGQSVTDSRGNRYDFPAGEYRFPLVRPGRYRLLIEPVAPYTAPSTATPAELAPLRRPDGLPFVIVGASYG